MKSLLPSRSSQRLDAFLPRRFFRLLAWAAALVISGAFQAAAAVATNGFACVDLTPFSLRPGEPATRQLAALPAGRQNYHGVPFLAGAPVALTGMESARISDVFPHAVPGIRIGSAARRIHLLHATLFAEKDGMPLAKVVFHYGDGTSESVRLGYGVHARGWITPRLEKRAELFDGNSQLAWSDADDRTGSGVRLFQTALDNPRPGAVIARIDLVSLFSHAAPFIVALTVEEQGSRLPPPRSIATRKAVRDLHALPDTVYRNELSVRVTDESGAALTNAIASLSITDDKESYYLCSAGVDTNGLCRLPYPPLHAVGVSVWVHAPGRKPEIVSESKTNVARFAGSYTVALKRGTSIGGWVKDAQGAPVAGAQIVIYEATRLSPHHYSRTDYDLAITGADGKWASQSLPADLTGLGFQVSHPDYRPALYVTPGFAPPPTNTSSSSSSSSSPVTYRRLVDGTLEPITRRAAARPGGPPLLSSNALLASSAEMILQPAILITGRALARNGRPLTNTPVIFQQNSPLGPRKHLLTDAAGRFRAMAAAPGSGTLSLVLENQSPVFTALNIAPGMPPVDLQLTPPRVLRGRVQDRSGRPVAGARVRVEEWQGTTDLVRFQTLSDAQGTFVWTGAPADQVTFYVSKTNYSNARSSFSGNTENVVINLSRPAGIYGRVFDVETKKPIETFLLVPGRKYSQNETRINWDRSESLRGFGGEYSLRLSSYYFQPEARVLIEAPGYEPQISRAFNGIDSHTNDFALKRGQGIRGLVLLPDGAPAAGAALAMIEKGDSGYMDNSGQVRANNGGADTVRSDAQGRFEFAPKLEPETIFVSHEQGFAQARAADVARGGRITLQKWGRLHGEMRVGRKGETDATVRLTSNYEMAVDPQDGRSSGFSFSLKADPDAEGRFNFDKVPPGEHRVAVEYRFKDDRYGDPAWSHGFFVKVKSGEAAQATLGGTGRQVVGRVQLAGGDQADVDWKRDVQRLMLVLPPLPGQPVNRVMPAQENQPLIFLPGFNARAAQPVNLEAMRERERAERSYVLLVETNGVFRADHVPPGKYQLVLNVTDPEDEYYNRRPIGTASKEVVVPGDPAEVNAPFDVGAVDLTIRPRLRVGRAVPSFEGRTQDGKTVKLSDFRGKPVLLHFWGLSLGYNTSEFQILKELQSNYAAAGRLVILGCNLDGPGNNPEQFAQRQGLTWPQLFLGPWNETPVPGMFGFNGNSGCVLIDAEGRLASGILRGTLIRTTVTAAMAE